MRLTGATDRHPSVGDGLARPISFEARYGAGCRRAVVLGGGGVVYVAWLGAYLHRLASLGIAVGGADRIVGTSAGSLVAAVVAAGRLERFSRLSRVLAGRSALIDRLAPAADLTASQLRALDLFERAGDAEAATIRAIGAAALAAATPSPRRLQASVSLMVQLRRWPDERLHISAVDAYTGERLVLTRSSGVPLVRAIAASASVPGLYPPQLLRDRRAMDGGVAGTGIHADLVAGAERALVLPIVETLPEARLTVAPDGCEREIAALRRTGTAVAVRYSRLPLTTNLMDPAEVPAALALGERQAAEDAGDLADFWQS